LTRRHQAFSRKTFRVFEQLDDVVNDIITFGEANDALGLEGKYLLDSFEIHYPIRFPRFTAVG